MDRHEKARTTPRARTLIVQRLAAGQSVGDVAAAEGASRPAFTAMMHDEKKESAVAFLEAAIAWFKAHGVVVQRVMTDNGSAYRSTAFAKAIAHMA